MNRNGRSGRNGGKRLKDRSGNPFSAKKERLRVNSLAEGKPQKIDDLLKFPIFTT
jgi:hypothetical protein